MGLRMDDLHAPTIPSGPSSQPTTNGTSKKQSLQELSAQKENFEAELSALSSVLESVGPSRAPKDTRRIANFTLQHGVNMNTGLTTFDGFPRADIDVAQIRTTRARIVRLKNDYKALMAKLEVAVHEHFAAGKSAETLPPTSTSASAPSVADASETVAGEAPAAQSLASAIEPPFARVNTVVENSPADTAGLKAGDKVTRFGYVDWTNHERLGKVARVVQQNENHTILVKVLRDGQMVRLELTPRRDWGGRGLLGCHLVPV
jgi:26S proteasome non-ATPase regulatory subunit 9